MRDGFACESRSGEGGMMEPDEKNESAEEKESRKAEDQEREEKIDRNLEDSFPASDPPEWVLGVERREPG
jgi:hypothetical protein